MDLGMGPGMDPLMVGPRMGPSVMTDSSELTQVCTFPCNLVLRCRKESCLLFALLIICSDQE